MGASSDSEKTEAPSARRLLQARRRGEVAQSRELRMAATLTVVVITFVLGAAWWLSDLVGFMRQALQRCTGGELPVAAGGRALRAAIHASLWVLLPAFIGALSIGLAQTGLLVAPQAIRFDWARLVPSPRRFLRAAAAREVGNGLLKIVLVAGVAWFTMRGLLGPLAQLPRAKPAGILGFLGWAAQRLVTRLVLITLALGVADAFGQRRRHGQALRMTRQEARREHKETEGDPHHKAERQRLHRELGEQRMLVDVRKADFVVVNPDHLAVAVRYDRAGEGAPVVVARGERLLAERIKAAAREAGVPIFRDVTLARALGAVAEGQEIPEALYQAVAEILRALAGETPGGDDTPGGQTNPPQGGAPPPGWLRG